MNQPNGSHSPDLTQDSLLRVLDSLKRILEQTDGEFTEPSSSPDSEHDEALLELATHAEIPVLKEVVRPGKPVSIEPTANADHLEQSFPAPHPRTSTDLAPATFWMDYLIARLRSDLLEEVETVVQEALENATPQVEERIRKRIEKLLPNIIADIIHRNRGEI